MSTNLEKLERDGYFVVDDFITEQECEDMRRECFEIVDNRDPNEEIATFKAGDYQKSTKYWRESGDKIRFFYEEDAFDKNGDLIVEKRHAFNKIAHALHVKTPAFRRVTFGERFRSILKELGYIEPIAFQSMCIFKPKKIGTAIVPHQDMNFLYVYNGRLLALWIALDDADVDNGCVRFIPGSNKDGIHKERRMVKAPTKENPYDTLITAPMCQYDDDLFVPVPVKKRGALIFDGYVVHKSEPNTSDKSRLVYTLHTYEGKGGVYSLDNWIQPDGGYFMPVYTTNPERPETNEK